MPLIGPEDHLTYHEATDLLDARDQDWSLVPPQEKKDSALQRMSELAHVLGDPQLGYPIIRVSGTNGKTTTSRLITECLRAKGLAVGTYTSPHLQRVNERIAWDGVALTDEQFAEAIERVTRVEGVLDGRLPSYISLLLGAALSYFADVAVDAAVVEVGVEHAWDQTNICPPTVSVVTNIDIDHVAVLGSTRSEIARHVASVVSADAPLICGEPDDEMIDILKSAGPAELYVLGEDFGVIDDRLAVGGHYLSLKTPEASYDGLFLPLHGAHQAVNAACALAAAEVFFGAPLEPDVAAEALANITSPGRVEVVGRSPLVVLDGAHNPAGAEALAITLDEEFSTVENRILVVGVAGDREPVQIVEPLINDGVRSIVACTAPSSKAIPADEIAKQLAPLGVAIEVASSPQDGLNKAMRSAQTDDMVVVMGSLYLVGAIRTLIGA